MTRSAVGGGLMAGRVSAVLPGLLGKLGALAGGLLAVELMSVCGGIPLWATQPLWLNLLPLVAGPLAGFVLGDRLGRPGREDAYPATAPGPAGG